jgi:hypothetical protein
MKVQEFQDKLDLNVINQLLAFSYDVNLLGETVNAYHEEGKCLI